jgi:hypothetical protein
MVLNKFVSPSDVVVGCPRIGIVNVVLNPLLQLDIPAERFFRYLMLCTTLKT